MGNCAHYMYGMSRFAGKFNIQNYVNSMGNCVHYIYELSGFAEKLNIQKCINSTRNCADCLDLQKIEYLELRESNRKLCTLDVRIVWICRKLNIHNCINFTRNCVHYIYGLCRFTEN